MFPQVDKLVFIDASVYGEGTGNLTKLPKAVAYTGVSVSRIITLMGLLYLMNARVL